MSEIKVLKKDEELFTNLFPDNNLTHYFKTKDNSLRIAFFDNKQFVAIETPKGINMFNDLVLKQDTNNLYSLIEKKEVTNKKNQLQYNLYIGDINV